MTTENSSKPVVIMEVEQKIKRYREHYNSCKFNHNIEQQTSRDDPELCDACSVLSLSSMVLTEVPTLLTNMVNGIYNLYLDYNDIYELPIEFFEMLPNIKILSLIGNRIEQLPNNIGKSQELRELFLNENIITSLPESVAELSKLRILNAVGNKLASLSENISGLASLCELKLDDNDLEVLPDTIGYLDNLKLLDLDGNKISKLPESFGQLTDLVVLNLNGNKLSVLPSTFGRLKRLEKLDLSSNCLQVLPDDMGCSVCLQKLYLDNNLLTTLPEWISCLPQIQEISIRNNILSCYPLKESLGLISKKLHTLHMGGNKILGLPNSFSDLVNLENVNLGCTVTEHERSGFQFGNFISILPENFGDLVKLKSVHLEGNQLQELPESIGCLVHLEYLDLSSNQLYDLPDSFGSMKCLRVCLLSRNNLELLPSTIGNLSNLEDLRLDQNQLAELPESFGELQSLKYVDLFKNQLRDIPKCLACLTKLVSLDLEGNAFDIPYTKMPEVFKSVHYAPLDPKKADNWRGIRKNADIGFTSVIMSDDVESEPSSQENGITYNTLQNAINNSASLWRSHTAAKSRQQHLQSLECYNDEEAYSIGTDSALSTEISENSAIDNTVDVLSGGIHSIDNCEDWDKELEELQAVDTNPYGTPPNVEPVLELYTPGASEYRLIGAEYMFLPSVYHVPSVKSEIKHEIITVYQGQFEDAD